MDARTFGGHVHLIANDPDVNIRQMGDKMSATPGKVSILAADRQRAFVIIAIVQAHDDPMPGVGQGGIILVAAPLIIRVSADLLTDDHPAASTSLAHDWFAARVVQAIQKF